MARRGISEWARAEPDRPAFYSGDEGVSFGTFDARTTRLAHAIAERGIGAEDRVAIMLPNCVEFFEAWAGANKAGASVVLVNWHLKAEELAYILADSGARLLVVHSDLEEQVGAALASVPDCDVLVVGDDGEAGYRAVVDRVPEDAHSIELPVLTAPVFYTSGTTGRPKGVVHGHPDRDAAGDSAASNLAASEIAARNMDAQLALWGWSADDVHMVSGPAYHAGPGGWTMAALYVGAPTVILPAFDAREWLRLVERHRVTRSFMVPAHFIRILEVPEAERAERDLSSLRLIVHAGAPCPVPVKHRIIEALAPCEVSELYGMSEGGATRITMSEWLDRPGSVGTPWPGVEVRVLDAAGHAVAPGEQGVIYVRPPGAGFRYHDDPEKTAAAWRDGAFTVGDVGYLDEDGYLYLTDRAADMVIRGGVNVYPREIEEVLHAHPSVVDCAVFGVPDERLGEQLHAVVEVRAAVTPEGLREHCRQRLADFKVPASVELVDELPRQPNGKVLKRLLRDRHWEGRTTRI